MMEEEAIPQQNEPVNEANETPVTGGTEESPEREHHYKPLPKLNRATRRLLARNQRRARTRGERRLERLLRLLVCPDCHLPSLGNTQNRCQCKAKTQQQQRRETFMKMLQEQLQSGTMTINEARTLLGMPPVDAAVRTVEEEGRPS